MSALFYIVHMTLRESDVNAKIEVYKPTKEDWHGSFRIQWQGEVMLVRVSTFPMRPWSGNLKKLWRVCVWGDDDCGMEKDFLHPDEAKRAFDYIVGLEYVNRIDLFNIGFQSA